MPHAPAVASAKALHLHASALVSRRPAAGTLDPACPRALRALAAQLLRAAFPESRRWRAMRDPGAVDVVAFGRMGPGWGDAALAGLAAAGVGDVAGAGDAAARLSALAEDARLPLAAAVLAEAAALADLDDAERALRVATLARDRADHRAAEWWGLRAAKLARRSGAGAQVRVRAWARVADARAARGEHKTALSARLRECRAARDARSRDLVARALHSLAFAYHFAGEPARVWTMLPRLLRAYPHGHPRLANLTLDLAWLRLEQGDPRAALATFKRIRPHIHIPSERVTLAVHMADCAARLGMNGESDEYAAEALGVLQSMCYGDGAAWALATLARVALERGDLAVARSRGRAALVIAEARGEDGAASDARRVLAAVVSCLPR